MTARPFGVAARSREQELRGLAPISPAPLHLFEAHQPPGATRALWQVESALCPQPPLGKVCPGPKGCQALQLVVQERISEPQQPALQISAQAQGEVWTVDRPT